MEFDIQLKNLLAFCILMENNDGLIGKSPDYIKEKFERYVMSGNSECWQYGLDSVNQEKLEAYVAKWLKKIV